MDDAPPRTFTDNLRRTFRRRPDMSHRAVPLDETLTGMALFAPMSVLGGALLAFFDQSPLALQSLVVMPAVMVHLDGVRHRWWAVGAGLTAAAAVAVPLHAAVDGWGHWGTLVAMLAGGVAGNLAHTAVTHVPPRSASRETPPGRT
ncbi:hypothetical protein Val02_81230 [Virgisporangium aliadipatigenens]|uniref:Uncharacterized protein n=1 Tax=Virgisporangium aliadipatigenens TaxID=741659 RepID=A0A8J4DWL8_9ACTN|nr:hypothetical protein [Virgisporangium aliadipatigenens]GIJ51237.1 hypothetical protein Val02_81230 [Virgisporangium aliadipatigenens]